MEYFTEKEIEHFKNTSLNYPQLIIHKEQHEVIEITEVTRIAGMRNNKGLPTQIEMAIHSKTGPTKYCTYILEK